MDIEVTLDLIEATVTTDLNNGSIVDTAVVTIIDSPVVTAVSIGEQGPEGIQGPQGIQGIQGVPGPPSSTWGGVSAGTGNAYTLTPSPVVSSLTTGLEVTWQADRNNTDIVTLNVSGLGAVRVLFGSDDLTPGQIIANEVLKCVYDGTFWQFLGGGGSANGNVQVSIFKYNRTSGTISKGTPVKLSGTDGIDYAIATSTAGVAFGLLGQDLTPGQYGLVVRNGPIDLTDWSGITGFSTLTSNSAYYLDQSAPGRMSLTPPTFGNGYLMQTLGVSVSTSIFMVEINQPYVT